MSSNKTLRQILNEKKGECFLVPCVYDNASNHAVVMSGFPVSLLSGGEVSISLNGAIDYGFTNLTDLQWVTSRMTQTSPIPVICDIEDGFGGPLAVYRAARRMALAGAAAIQLEDAGDMEDSTIVLPRAAFIAKVKAAIQALEGTDCMLIARTNIDPTNPEEFIEGCERLNEAMDLGAELAMMVKVSTLDEAKALSERVKGPKIFADVRADAVTGEPFVTMEQLSPLGYVMCSTHFTLKAAMEGMLEHGKEIYKTQSVGYTFTNAPATGIMSFSASAMFDPQAYIELENEFTGNDKEYTIVGNKVEDYPEGWVRPNIKNRL